MEATRRLREKVNKPRSVIEVLDLCIPEDFINMRRSSIFQLEQKLNRKRTRLVSKQERLESFDVQIGELVTSLTSLRRKLVRTKSRYKNRVDDGRKDEFRWVKNELISQVDKLSKTLDLMQEKRARKVHRLNNVLERTNELTDTLREHQEEYNFCLETITSAVPRIDISAGFVYIKRRLEVNTLKRLNEHHNQDIGCRLRSSTKLLISDLIRDYCHAPLRKFKYDTEASGFFQNLTEDSRTLWILMDLFG